MSIRLTESRIPAGFTPQDLGQADTKPDPPGQMKFALVSYLTSPIAKGSTVDYVVFVLGEDLAQDDNFGYQWTVKHSPSGDTKQDTTKVGIFQYTADRNGSIDVDVQVLRGSTLEKKLHLNQEIVGPEPGLEALLSPSGMLKHLNVAASVGSLGGNPRASRELINNFRRYVFAATDLAPPLVGIDLPARFLGAILYAEILRVDKSWMPGRDAELAAAAAELNGDLSLALGTQMDNALGVAQVTPQTLAMVAERSPGVTYTAWTELPSDQDKRPAIQNQILAKFNALPQTDKVDLFNFLRFPKSNILMCARLLRKLVTRGHRWPNATRAELILNEQALAIVATEYKIGGTNSPLPPKTGPPAASDAKASAYGRRLVGTEMLLPPIVLYFVDSTSKEAEAYGGFNLRRDDNDGAQRWDGSLVTAPGSYVKELQQDLSGLGFNVLRDVDGSFKGGFNGKFNGVFDIPTEWAVREFQIYARMPHVAAETTGGGARYVDRLTQVKNVLRYSGPVSGVVNAATRVALQYWKDSNWRCPVVIGAWTPGANPTNVFEGHDNVWLHDHVVSSTPRMYARDFTHYYPLSEAESDQLIVVGEFVSTSEGNGPWSTAPRHTQAEVRSSSLLGIDEASLDAKQRSTFKVIRAVAEVECNGYYDSLNAYDAAIISVGLFHWTIGRPTHIDVDEKEGELCGLLSYLANPSYRIQDAFQQAVGFFGMKVDEQWAANGQELFKKDRRKYSGWVSLQTDTSAYSRLAQTLDEANYLRTWHWFYRFVMAARTNPGFQQAMWDYARVRIRDLLSIPWGTPSDVEQRATTDGTIPDGAGGSRPVTVFDVFTSERAIGLLLRVHVLLPKPKIIDRGEASTALREALKQAKAATPTLGWATNPSDWSDGEEQALVTALLAQIKGGFGAWHQQSIQDVHDYPTWSATNNPKKFSLNPSVLDPEDEHLRIGRRSFKFFDNALPPKPDY